VSLTKQTSGDSGKKPKLHQVTELRKKTFGETRLSLFWPTNKHRLWFSIHHRSESIFWV